MEITGKSLLATSEAGLRQRGALVANLIPSSCVRAIVGRFCVFSFLQIRLILVQLIQVIIEAESREERSRLY